MILLSSLYIDKTQNENLCVYTLSVLQHLRLNILYRRIHTDVMSSKIMSAVMSVNIVFFNWKAYSKVLCVKLLAASTASLISLIHQKPWGLPQAQITPHKTTRDTFVVPWQTMAKLKISVYCLSVCWVLQADIPGLWLQQQLSVYLSIESPILR